MTVSGCGCGVHVFTHHESDAGFEIIEIQSNDAEIPFMHHMLGAKDKLT